MKKTLALWAALTAVALFATGCTSAADADTPDRTAPPAGAAAPSAAPSAGDKAPEAPSAADQRAAAYRKWGLKPFAEPPAPPAKKPLTRAAGGPVPVISDIPTDEKIVFITIDDGAEKDPGFVAMMRDLKVPVTMFLTDSAIRGDYAYFEPLVGQGHGVANHTLTHPNLRTLSQEAQRREICGQQEKLAQRYGERPRLLRPPYGNWNEATRAAAKECGVDAIVLWRESMQIQNMQYQRGDRKLHPGDIILAHFRGPSELKGTTMTEMTANLLRHIQEQGFTVARLEDYV
ncbi:polysaccharide deacetylase family protein [Streptomyces roseicoloratus]|uniref:Polysaccharide deacetylase family protein n=1 Tax=Streptomyces roseicoloratus TaxID=2508722 RepID=A0ABY9RVF5_9ACTN|nr:polysaccharide deacetylase family protein [Streptomyces roseicoloratus]WMX45481.1 polysaccharide deacetylase family protein [Streptomyces roseicoloratus]